MEDNCAPQNEDNDQTEYIHRKRFSSILKAPRSPLHDLGCGNEIHQNHNLEKRRKSSRRVSFAETISSRLFVPDVHENAVGELSHAGMDTLLHAPIQTSLQQPEHMFDHEATSKSNKTILFSDENDMDITASNTIAITQSLVGNPGVEEKHQKIDFKSFLASLNADYAVPSLKSDCSTASEPALANGMDILLSTSMQQSEWDSCKTYKSSSNDKTIVFSDENDMDMTASNTITITRNVGNPEVEEKPRKIDFISFLSSLNAECQVPKTKLDCTIASESTNSTCFTFQSKPMAYPVKKNIKDFLSSLKPPGKTVKPCVEGDDKENLFTCIPKCNFFSLDEMAYMGSHTQENSNSTHVFREKHDAVNITECYTSSIKTFFPNASLSDETGAEDTGYSKMDMSGNQCVKVSLSKDNVLKNLTEISLENFGIENKCQMKKMELAVQCPDSKICYEDQTEMFEDEMEITRSHTVLIGSSDLQETDNQNIKTFPMSVTPSDKTIVFGSSCGAMETTKNLTIAVGSKTSRAASSISFNETSHRTGKTLSSIQMEKAFIPSLDNDMDITKSHTVAIDDFCFKRQEKMGSRVELLENLEKDTEKMEISKYSTVSQRPKQEFLRPVLPSADTTNMFRLDDMRVRNNNNIINSVEPEGILTLKNDGKTNPGSKSFLANATCFSPSEEQNEIDITKGHTVVINSWTMNSSPNDNIELHRQNDKRSINSSDTSVNDKTVLNEHQKLYLSHNDNFDSMFKLQGTNKVHTHGNATFEIDMDISKNYTVGINIKPILPPASTYYMVPATLCDKTIINSTDRHGMKPADSDSSLPVEQQNFLVPLDSTDKTVIFSRDLKGMDITKSHTVVIDDKIVEATLSRNTNRKSMPGLRMSSLPIDQTVVFSKTEDDMDLTKSHTVAIDRNSVLLAERENLPSPLVSVDKTVIFTCDQDEMDITKSHTVAIDDKIVDVGRDLSAQTLPRNINRKSMLGLRISSVPIDQTVVFSKTEDNMDLTKSHTVAINRNSLLLAERDSLPSPLVSVDKTVMFTCDQNEMDITHSHTVAIDDKIVDEGRDLSAQTLSRNTNMDLTKSHTVAIDRNSVLLAERENLPSPLVFVDKTVMFTCDQDEMDITKSHTDAIDDKIVEARVLSAQTLSRNSNRKSMPGLRMSSVPIDQTVVFSRTEDMDLTKSHTVAIDRNSVLLAERENLPSPLVSVDKTVMFTCDQDEMDITKSHTVAIDDKIVDVGRDLSAQTLPRNINRKSMLGLRISSVPIDQTVVFSKTEDNMDLTKSHTVAINRNSLLLAERDSLPSPLVSVDKTVMFTCDQNEMDITHSHTVAIDDKIVDEGRDLSAQTLSRNTNMDLTKSHTVAIDRNSVLLAERENLPSPLVFVDKTVMFTCDQDEMDITKSHTDAIDDKIVEARVLSAQTLSRNSNRKSMPGLRMSSVPIDQTVVFSRTEDMDLTKSHTVAIDRNSVLLAERENLPSPLVSVDKTVMFTCDQDEMDITKSHTVAIDDKIVDVGRDLSAQTLPRNINRKSMLGLRISSVPIDQTVVFSKTEDNMDLTKSHTVAINRNSLLLAERDSLPSPLVSVDKTVMFTCDQNEMDITHSHTVAIDDKIVDEGRDLSAQTLSRNTNMDLTKSHTVAIDRNSVLLAERENLPSPLVFVDKTVMFTCDQDEMDITKSHTDAIDDKIVEARVLSTQTLSRNSNRKSMPGLRMSSVPIDQTVVFSRTEDMDLTKSHTVAIDRNSVLLAERENLPSSLVSVDKTVMFTCDQDEMDISKFQTVALDDKIDVKAGDPHMQSLLKNTNRKSMIEMQSPLVPPVSTVKTVLLTCNQNDVNEKSHSVTIDKKFIKDNETWKMKVPENCNVFSQNVATSLCSSQSLENLSRHNLNRLSLKLTENNVESHKSVPKSFVNEAHDITLEQCEKAEERTGTPRLQHISTLQSLLCKKGQDNLNKDELNKFLSCRNFDMKDDTMKQVSYEKRDKNVFVQVNIDACSDTEKIENEMTVCENVRNVNISLNTAEKMPCVGTIPVEFDLHTLSHWIPKEKFRQTNIADIQLKLISLKGNLSFIQYAMLADHIEQSHKSAPNPNLLQLEMLPETHHSGSQTGAHKHTREMDSRGYKMEDNLSIALVETESKDRCKLKRMPFGAYPPKLPNKKNSNVSNTEYVEERSDPQLSGLHVDTVAARPDIVNKLSISQSINEEILPSSLEDLDFNDSFNFELPEWALEEICEKKAIHNQHSSELREKCKSQKRVRDLEEGEELLKKKMKRNEIECDCDSTNEYQASHLTSSTESDHLVENGTTESFPTILAKSLDRNYSSSSSQDSRTDGTSVDLSSQPYSQVEAQFFMDSGSAYSLWQKLQDGVITVREFFSLLQVHVQIQRPRHSELPANHKLSSDPTPEDFLIDQYIYRPKLMVYEEDCQALCQAITELKLFVRAQDKTLLNVNSLLWEAMRTCSDEELRSFGVEMKRMRSCFMKKSKIICHEEKVKLYSKLLQTAQVQSKQLQSTVDELGSLLEEVDSCISALETETVKLEESELEKCVVQYNSKLTELRNELENLKTKESKCCRELYNLEEQKEKLITQINNFQKEAQTIGKQLEKYNFSEWELNEWGQDHAVFTFLYDSVELIVTFGDSVDGALFNNKACRTISDVTFESLMDDDRAPSSSLLIHRLIFQYLKNKGILPTKYTTQQQLPQLLFDVSLVVSRCRLLGEEIEFLMKWGGMFNLLKTDVYNTEVKLLFSSSAALAKFDMTIFLSSDYPTLPLSFTVLKHIGNIGQDEICSVLSDVPLGTNYLRRAVKRIHQSLLQETVTASLNPLSTQAGN
ncbi:LOW QUALITY PROTEIN: kinetochore scaffold 1 [Rhinatrema bivittatum]|uniref:LOW QUALITY PROTEIN: kinetochore scaffold 1 n=1 Tax=Rhinatrema bivittatum TaxID=194408 RepID=UPI00112EEA8F|nr:LOW QUALITY PROTEIN: kinetochore scaffold 1 [Rhinatrema bivittatum]